MSTEEQAADGLGLKAQRAAILAEVERRGWHYIIEDTGYSGKDATRRGLEVAREVL